MNKKEKVYDLLAYIATSAKEVHIDPQIYASLRLLSVMMKVIEIAEDVDGIDQAFIQKMQQVILDNRSLLLKDREEYGLFLDNLIIEIAKKVFI